MKSKLLLGLIAVLFICGCQEQSRTTSDSKVHIKDGWFYIDGEKFFAKGIGYEPGGRPGENPYEGRKFNAEDITLDMNRIKDGGFNTIRTWASLLPEELELIDSMGIKIIFGLSISPHGDFGDPEFIAQAEDHLREVLSYSKNYDSIITYLLMNEPLSEDFHRAGAAETVSLWARLKKIINQEHPGVAVSFANTAQCDYIDMSPFDMSAYNLYVYGPTTNHSVGYTGAIEWYKNKKPENPLIITEYGLSVSPDGVGDYGYGGNTLKEQADGDVMMYRGLIDGNAQGGCVFIYLDGWWKNGDEENDADTHGPAAEEWYGLFGIDDENSDRNGTARPAWHAMKEYNMCVVTSPKNGGIYGLKVPLEFFPDERVKTIKVSMDDQNIYTKQTEGESYISDSVALDFGGHRRDAEFKFEFLDESGIALKSESVVFLCSKDPVRLPTLDVNVLMTNLNDGDDCPVEITVDNQSYFTIKDNTVDYFFYPHIGWGNGIPMTHSLNLTNGKEVFKDSFPVPAESIVMSVSAGMTIQYGKFEKRISDQKIIQRGSWMSPFAHESIR